MNYGQIIAEKIRRYREENHLYQWQLGEKLGVSDAAIGKYENERVMPSVDVIVRFARMLGITVDELLLSSFNHQEDGGDDGEGKKAQFLTAVWKAHQEIFK